MKTASTRCLFLLLAGASWVLLPAAPLRSADDPKDGGWVSLFDGKNLDGWVQRGGKAKYQVADGQIVGTSVPITGNSFLCTKRNYGDFILELEFKVHEALNSGVQIRSQYDEKANRVFGYQVEIDPSDRAWTGGIYDEGRRGWLNNLEKNEPARKAFKKNDWNKFHIECKGDSIKTWLNDVPAADLKDSLTPAGFIALQVHGVGKKEDPLEVRFKNLRIKEAQADGPELVSVAKIWDQGKHNAFTDLIRWRGKWYCTFREADAHVGGDGRLRVLESADGAKWEPVGLVVEEGIDLRDPHLSITANDRLMVVAGGSVYRGTKTLMGRQPRVSFSKDGRTWTPPQRVLAEDDWLWRVTWHAGKCYGVAYNPAARKTKEAKEAAKELKPVSPAPADWKLKLVVSDDGVTYDLITYLGVPGDPNETTLRFLPGGELMAMVRREGGSTFGWLGTSKPPFKDWTWHETKYRFGGPNFIVLPDGRLFGASRLHPGGPKTTISRMTTDSYQPALTLPSGGDTSYAGLVWHEDVLWVSYYSSHEGKSSIYLAKVKLP